MKDKFFFVFGIAVIVWSFYVFLGKPASPRYQHAPKMLYGIKLEIAETPEKRALGLSGREALARGSGMLFVFPESGLHGFWMKGMKFPIDIVWLSENYEILGIERNISPETYPKVFYPPSPAKYVLELNATESDVLEFMP